MLIEYGVALAFVICVGIIFVSDSGLKKHVGEIFNKGGDTLKIAANNNNDEPFVSKFPMPEFLLNGQNQEFFQELTGRITNMILDELPNIVAKTDVEAGGTLAGFKIDNDTGKLKRLYMYYTKDGKIYAEGYDVEAYGLSFYENGNLGKVDAKYANYKLEQQKTTKYSHMFFDTNNKYVNSAKDIYSNKDIIAQSDFNLNYENLKDPNNESCMAFMDISNGDKLYKFKGTTLKNKT